MKTSFYATTLTLDSTQTTIHYARPRRLRAHRHHRGHCPADAHPHLALCCHPCARRGLLLFGSLRLGCRLRGGGQGHRPPRILPERLYRLRPQLPPAGALHPTLPRLFQTSTAGRALSFPKSTIVQALPIGNTR
jgi:hypothetical protein